jgi:hypothetical protein
MMQAMIKQSKKTAKSLLAAHASKAPEPKK